MCCGQDIHQPVLGVVGVLVFVHVDVLEARLVALAHLGEDLQQGDGLHDEVVEVHRVVLVEASLVEVVDLGHVLGDIALGGAQVVVGGSEDVLGGRDLGRERAWIEALWVLPELDDTPFDEPHLVSPVVDRELALVP
jgi:hypothetical protein